MNLIYKRVPPRDSGLYRDIRLESLELHPEAFETSHADALLQPELYFESLIKAADSAKFVVGAYNKNKLVGICAFVDYNNHAIAGAGTLIQMYVNSAFRGNKVGEGLLVCVAKEASKIPAIHSIALEVKATNSAAINLYIRAGFEFVESDNHSGLKCMVLEFTPSSAGQQV